MSPPLDLAPLLGLRLRTPRLELRLPTVEEIDELAAVAEAGVHPPGEMPFAIAWTDGVGTPEFRAGFRAYHLGRRADWAPGDWWLELGVWEAGRLVGTQSLHTCDEPGGHAVGTGSWLGLAHHRGGVGTEMRAAVLELAFRGLGATTAWSGAIEGNEASARVSAKLGYIDAGAEVASPRGTPTPVRRFRREAAGWASPVEVEIGGLEACLPLLRLEA